MYSLRRVLAVRFSVTLFVALGLIALWAMLGVGQTLRRQINQALEATLGLQLARLATGTPLPHLAPGVEFIPYFESGSRIVVLRDAGQRIVDASTDSLKGFPLDTVAFLAALNGRTASSTESWNGRSVRAIYGRAPAGNPAGASVVEVAASLKPLSDAYRRLLQAMAGTVILGTIAVAIGAFWLAGAAVAPVAEVGAQAQALNPSTPGKRITTHSDITEYQSLIEVLNDLLGRCEKAFLAQRRLTADLGHELRTPLTALRGELEIALRSERTPAHYQKVLHSGLEEIDHLNGLCDSLMLINSIESTAVPLHRSPTDMNDIVVRSLYGQRHEVEKRELTVKTTLDETEQVALLDPDLTLKMMDEMVQNAVKFSPVGGRIAIGTTGSVPGVVIFWVEDSGPGIAPEHLPHLFEPFFQADEARIRDQGSGLGLTLAATIARAHAGSITASNLPQGGARFEVRLPSLPVPARTNGRGASAA